VTARRDLLDALAPGLVDVLREIVREQVDDALREERARVEQGEWLPLADAAERLGCSTDAVRMRVKRKTIDARRHGRRIYVRLDGASRDNASVPWPTTKTSPRATSIAGGVTREE
jgi:hypothetical protein